MSITGPDDLAAAADPEAEADNTSGPSYQALIEAFIAGMPVVDQ